MSSQLFWFYAYFFLNCPDRCEFRCPDRRCARGLVGSDGRGPGAQKSGTPSQRDLRAFRELLRKLWGNCYLPRLLRSVGLPEFTWNICFNMFTTSLAKQFLSVPCVLVVVVFSFILTLSDATFRQILPTAAFLFFFRTDSTDSPRTVHRYFRACPFFTFYFCFFSTFYFLVASAFERTLN